MGGKINNFDYQDFVYLKGGANIEKKLLINLIPKKGSGSQQPSAKLAPSNRTNEINIIDNYQTLNYDQEASDQGQSALKELSEDQFQS